MNKICNYTDAEDRPLADAFLELPSRKELPDYYDVIRQPLDIKKIRYRISSHKYRSLDDLQEDFFTMCHNAQTYNVEESQIFQDSINLMTIFKEIREKVHRQVEEQAAAADAARASQAAARAQAGGGAEDDDDEVSLIGIDSSLEEVV